MSFSLTVLLTLGFGWTNILVSFNQTLEVLPKELPMEDSPDTSKASTTRESFLPDMYLKKMTRDNGGMNKQMRRPVDENKLEE